jgi:hypothetical protein
MNILPYYRLRLLCALIFFIALDGVFIYFFRLPTEPLAIFGACFLASIQFWFAVEFGSYGSREIMEISFKSKARREEDAAIQKLQLLEAQKNEILLQALDNQISTEEAKNKIELINYFIDQEYVGLPAPDTKELV